MEEALRQIVAELKTLNKNLEKMDSHLDKNLDKIHTTLKDENSITSQNTLKHKLTNALKDLGEIIKNTKKAW